LDERKFRIWILSQPEEWVILLKWRDDKKWRENSADADIDRQTLTADASL